MEEELLPLPYMPTDRDRRVAPGRYYSQVNSYNEALARQYAIIQETMDREAQARAATPKITPPVTGSAGLRQTLPMTPQVDTASQSLPQRTNTPPARQPLPMPDWTKAPITQGFGPTNETLDSGYNGYPHFNKGNDYGVPVGTPITAIRGGKVIAAGPAEDGWGIRVWVQDADGYIHNYGHLGGVNVKIGQFINPGDLLGSSGNTGRSTGPHLSYDVWDSTGRFIDPTQFLR